MELSLNLKKKYGVISFAGIVTFLLTTLGCYSQLNPEVLGNCLETKYSFYRQGQVEQQFTKKYDAQGHLIKEVNTFSSRFTGAYTDEYSYEYDAKGNNTKIIYRQNGQIKKVTQKVYDALGKLATEITSLDGNINPVKQISFTEGGSEQVFFNNDGSTESIKEKTTFNKDGQILTKEVFSANGNLGISETSAYNQQGKLIKFTHFDAVDKVTLMTDYEYDSKGNISKEITYRNNILYAETDNIYDSGGQLTKKTRLNGKNQVDYFFTYEYNMAGLMSKENYFYNDQITSIRTFEYDSQSNKIKESLLDSKGKVTAYKEWEYFCK